MQAFFRSQKESRINEYLGSQTWWSKLLIGSSKANVTTSVILQNVFAGLLCLVVNLLYSATFASIVFSQELRYLLPVGLNLYIVTAIVTGLTTTLFSSFYFGIGGPDPNVIPVLHLLAMAVLSASQTPVDVQILPTILFAFSSASLFTGILLFTFGSFNWGKIVQYTPTPVSAGFLAGCGYVLIDEAFVLLSGKHLLFLEETFSTMSSEMVLIIVSSFVLAVITLSLRITHAPVFTTLLPILFVAAIASVYILLLIRGISIEEARLLGWLMPDTSSSKLNDPIVLWKSIDFTKIHWRVLFENVWQYITIFVISTTTLLLRANGVELLCSDKLEEPSDFDRELQTAGAACIFSGCASGTIGYLEISGSVLNYSAGATSRFSGLVAVFGYTLTLFIGNSILPYLPTPVLSSLVFYLGMYLLYEWVIRTYWGMPWVEYLAIWLIFLSIICLGFIVGLLLGVVVAIVLFSMTYSNIDVVKKELRGSDHRSHIIRNKINEQQLTTLGSQIQILLLRGYLFFGVAGDIIRRVQQRIASVDVNNQSIPLRFVILDFQLVSGIDSSAMYAFLRLKSLLELHYWEDKRGQRFHPRIIFTNLSPSFEELFRRPISGQRSVLDTPSSGRWTTKSELDLDTGLEYCEDVLLNTYIEESRGKSVQRLLAAWLKEFASEGSAGVTDRPSDVVRRFMTYMSKFDLRAGQEILLTKEQEEAKAQESKDDSNEEIQINGDSAHEHEHVENTLARNDNVWCGSLIFVESGLLVIQTETVSPEGQTIAELTSTTKVSGGTVIGESDFYGTVDSRGISRKKRVKVIVKAPSEVYCLSREHMITMEREEPQIALLMHRFIISVLSDRLSQVHSELNILLH